MNLRWSPSEAEVQAANEIAWTGWQSKVTRRFAYETVLRVWVSTVVLSGLGGLAGFFAAALLPDLPHGNRLALWAISATAMVTALAVAVFVLAASPVLLVRSVALGIGPLVLLPLFGVMIFLALIATHPSTDVALILLIEAPSLSVYTFRARVAAVIASVNPVLYGVFLAINHDPGWFPKWFMVSSTVLATSIVTGTIASRAERSYADELATRRELATLNTTLESRVADGVAEVTRLSRLQRFLSPSIADIVASNEHESLLAPHRRKIAVFFIDLRGFTAFTNRAEPEDVLAVLEEYYAAVGVVLRRHGATIGGYAGDGIMAFFGDPVPTPEPALEAIAMVVELRQAMSPLLRQWDERAYQLGYGVGVAFGHATLGAVGSDGRFDYTPLGAVVNLAARLCAKADNEQALMDRATHLATVERHPSVDAGEVELKGFASDVSVYALA